MAVALLEKYVNIAVIVAFVAGMLALQSCEEEIFDPKTEYVEKVVIFATLDRSQSYQIVRLESTYDAEVKLPIVPTTFREITEAEVWIRSRRGGSFQLKDTLIEEADGSLKTIWISRDLEPREATTYSLSVRIPDEEEVTANTTVPSRAYLRTTPVEGGLRLSGLKETTAPPGGFYFRLFVIGKKVVGTEETEYRLEVPIGVSNTTGEFSYSKPSRTSAAVFQHSMILETRARLKAEEDVIGRELMAIAYTMDDAFYAYYKTVRGFDDPVSVRQDKPNTSNIQGGLGVFGANVADSMRMLYGETGK